MDPPSAGRVPVARWRRWMGPWAEFGLWYGSLYLLHLAAQRLTGGRAAVVAYGLYAQPIGVGSYTAVRDDARTVVVPVVSDSSLCADFPRPPEVIVRRFAAGSACRAVLVKGRFAGYIWISRRQHDEDEVRVRYLLGDPGVSAWDFDVFVTPEQRVGRTLGRLWKAVDAELAAQGVRWSFSRISRFNPSSEATHVRLGAVRVGSATFFVAGQWQLMVASQPPYIHASMSASGRPTLNFSAPR